MDFREGWTNPAEDIWIVSSFDATAAQTRVAKQTAKDLTSLLVAHTLETIEGRTALLSGLIVELNQVIGAVRANPPYQDAISSLTTVLTKAEKLFKKEKKALL